MPAATQAGLSYNLRIGTTPGGQDICAAAADSATGYRRVVNIGNVQKNLSWTLKTPLPPRTYYVGVQSIDSVFAGSIWKEMTLTVSEPASVSDIKAAGKDTIVQCNSGIVTAAFPYFFYIEATDRSSGIRVEKAAHGLSSGMKVDVVGSVRINADGELYIAAATAKQVGTDLTSLKPLGIVNRAIISGDFGNQASVTGGTGLNNIGLLVSVRGKVAKVDAGSGCFYLDDGSSLVSTNGQRGLKVIGIIPEADREGTMVKVTGIISCFKLNNVTYPVILSKSVVPF